MTKSRHPPNAGAGFFYFIASSPTPQTPRMLMSQLSSTATEETMEITSGQLGPSSAITENAGLEQLALRLDLQSMSVLLTVLANVARLGCELHNVSASDTQARVTMLVPARLAHRVESCLAQIIGVLSVSVTPESEQ
jgi:hypothetical protein